MNYYKRHLGDYAKDTGHLSALEHGVFNLLLDWYYASECPVPADKAYRIAKASTAAERAATDAVLADFFKRDGEVWRNKRADEEIERSREKARKASNSAAKRWANAPETQCENDANAMRTHCEGNATRAPVHQPLAISQEKAKAKAAPGAPVDFRTEVFRRWKELPDGGGGAFLAKLIRDHGEDAALNAADRTLEAERADPKGFAVGILRGASAADSAHDALMARVQ